jgi:hypothetical protein
MMVPFVVSHEAVSPPTAMAMSVLFVLILLVALCLNVGMA